MNADVVFKSGRTVTIEDIKEIRQLRRGEFVETVSPEKCFVIVAPTIFMGKQILTVSQESVECVAFYD